MNICNLCDKEGIVHFRIQKIDSKEWIFVCKQCLELFSLSNKYVYGGTRKLKRIKKNK